MSKQILEKGSKKLLNAWAFYDWAELNLKAKI